MEFQKLSEQYLINSSNVIYASSIDKSKKLPQVRQRVKENSRLLPTHAVDIMTEWYDRHYSNPYPTYRDCEMLAQQGNITINQVKQWFVNVRRRTQNQFRKTRDTRCTKRKVDQDQENLNQKRVKIETVEIRQTPNYSYSAYSLDSSSCENNTVSESNSPTTYRYNYPIYNSPINNNSPNISQQNDSPILASSPIQNQNYFSQFSMNSNFSSDYTSNSNYYAQNTSDYCSYYNSSTNYQYYNNYPNVYNFQYY